MSRPGKPRSYENLRSHRWFGVSDLRSFGHRSRAIQMGYENGFGAPVGEPAIL